jgi:hypothetical protein
MQRYRGEISGNRRPFWLPASNYYILAASVAIAFFFLVWGILNDGQDDTPWIPAGIGAAIILSSAVILREIVLRDRRNRFLASQRQIDQSVRGIAQRAQARDPEKLTLERNAAILREISRKSEAAKVLARFAEGHRDVFELCEEYLGVVRKELPKVAAGSPRLVALLRGTEVASKYHYYHMLQWAEIESRGLTKEAAKRDKISEKLDSAQSALGVVEFALQSYPDDPALLDSQKILLDLVTSIKIKDLMGKAERSAFKGNHRRALSLYQDALFFLQREHPGIESELVDHINEEISRLRVHLLES